MAKAMVRTVRPKASDTPTKPIPSCGNAAASTALERQARPGIKDVEEAREKAKKAALKVDAKAAKDAERAARAAKQTGKLASLAGAAVSSGNSPAGGSAGAEITVPLRLFTSRNDHVVDPADRANGAVEHLSSDDLPDALVPAFALTLGFGTSTQFPGYAGISGIVGAPS